MSAPRHTTPRAAPPEIPEADWPVVEEGVLRLLPPVLKAVVKALGYVRGREWLLDYGGLPVRIPHLKRTALDLAEGELARLRVTLAPHLDDDGRVCLPKADRLLRLTRNASIQAEKHHQSITAQARMYRLSTRQIVNIRRQDGDDQQGRLF